MQDVITKDKIDALPDHAELRVAVGSIITRAAREKIKEKGITLQYIKENSKEGVADADQEKRDDKERGFVTVIGRDQVRKRVRHLAAPDPGTAHHISITLQRIRRTLLIP
jgi:ACT domain-containing protein